MKGGNEMDTIWKIVIGFIMIVSVLLTSTMLFGEYFWIPLVFFGVVGFVSVLAKEEQDDGDRK